MNRAETAKFLLLARYGEVQEMTNNGRFSDVLDGEWYTKFVMQAAILGVINGYPDGKFRPAQEINTAEFLKMITLMFNFPENLAYDFVDVPKDAWFAKYAGAADRYDLFPERGQNLEPSRQISRYDVAVAIYQYLKNR